MNKLIQQILALLFTFISLACLSGSAFSMNVDDKKEEKQKLKAKHKVIQLEKQADKPVKIEIVENGDAKVIEIASDELQDKQALAEKLSELDEDTRNTVLSIIENSAETHHKGMAFVHALSDSDVHTEFVANKEVVLISDGEEVSFSGTLKGHHSAIVKLIEKGEFSREELDEIRAALDAKY